MKATLLLIAAFSIFLLGANAQQQTFSTVFFNTNFDTQANDIVRTPDNKYYVAGQHNQDGFLMKTDSAGNILWTKLYETGFTNKFSNMKLCSDGGLAITGVADDGNALLLKTDLNGDTLWSRMLDLGNYSEAFSVSETVDSGLVCCGYVYGASSETSMFVARTNKNGVLLWAKTFSYGNSANYAYGVKQTPDSGFVVAAYVANYPTYESYAVLMKLDENGDTIFTKGYYGTISETNRANDVIALEDGYLFTGEYQGQLGLTRVDSAGQVLWHRTMFTYMNSYLNSIPTKLKAISGNRLLIVTVGEQFSFGELIVADSAGMQLICQNLEMVTAAAVEASDSGFMVVGNGPIYGVKSIDEFLTVGHFAMMKTDTAGNSVSCQYQQSPQTTTSILTAVSLAPAISTLGSLIAWEPSLSSVVLDTSAGCVTFLGGFDEQQNSTFSIYPNPSNGSFTLKFDRMQSNEKWIIEVYSPLGACVFSASEKMSDEISVELDNFKPGLYFLIVSTSTGRTTKMFEIQ